MNASFLTLLFLISGISKTPAFYDRLERPWLLMLLVIAVIPGFLSETHFSGLEYSLFYRMTPERRQLDYLRSLSAGDKAAKEVQLFGLSAWLLSRYRNQAHRLHLANRNLALRKGVAAILFSLLGLAGFALENFFNARSAIAQGAWASDYELHRQPIARGELVPVTRAKGKSSVALAPIKKKQ